VIVQLFMIAAGGALGAVLRFLVSNSVYALAGRDFPYGTLTVNVVGSLLMGMLYVVLIEKTAFSIEWRGFLVIGVLGAFTTFSTFSIDTLLLIESGQHIKALLNMLASVILCIVATWVGVIGLRHLYGA